MRNQVRDDLNIAATVFDDQSTLAVYGGSCGDDALHLYRVGAGPRRRGEGNPSARVEEAAHGPW